MDARQELEQATAEFVRAMIGVDPVRQVLTREARQRAWDAWRAEQTRVST